MKQKINFSQAINEQHQIYGIYYPNGIGHITSFKKVIEQLHFHTGILKTEPDKQWNSVFSGEICYVFNFTDYYWINECSLNHTMIDKRNGPVRLYKSELHKTASCYNIGSNCWTFATNIEDCLQDISRTVNFRITEKEKGIILKTAALKFLQ